MQRECHFAFAVRRPGCVPQPGGCSPDAQGIPVLRASGSCSRTGCPSRVAGLPTSLGSAERHRLAPNVKGCKQRWESDTSRPRKRLAQAPDASSSSGGVGTVGDQLFSLLQSPFAFKILIPNCFPLISLNLLMVAILMLYLLVFSH